MAASGGGSSSGGAGGDSDAALLAFTCLLPYEAITFEKDKRDNRKVIGRGATGIVYAGTLRSQAVAVKEEAVEGADEVKRWLTQVQLQYAARCPTIATVLGAVIDRDEESRTATYYIVMERLAGSVESLVLAPGGEHAGAPLSTRLYWLAGIAAALRYVHAAGVVHADVKPGNIMLTATSPYMPVPMAKMADFGSAVIRSAGMKTATTHRGERGTLLYMDPCLLDNSGSLRAASDVYSFGMTAWHLLVGKAPLQAELLAAAPTSATGLLTAVRDLVCGPAGRRPSLDALAAAGVPATVVSLVARCWAPTAADRPAMEEVAAVMEAAAATAAGAGNAATAKEERVPPAPVAARATVPVAPKALAYTWSGSVSLEGHSNLVRSLVVLPDGRLASGASDKAVRLWDPACGGGATVVLEGCAGEVLALAVLADGCLVGGEFVSEIGGAISVWDVGAAPPVRTAQVGCASGILALVVQRDGCLAAGCQDGKVRLVDVADGRVVGTLEGHTDFVRALAALRDGHLASGSSDKTIRLWDPATRACTATLAGHTWGVYALLVLGDGRLASGSGDRTLRLWDAATGACVRVLEGHTDAVQSLAVVGDGRLASGGDDTTIRLWDAATGACSCVLTGHSEKVMALAALPGGRLASGSDDKAVRLWEV
ncbi:MAG: WD40 repeat domain-containing serine/threonine-protein kinase [Burkholderiaceae bacterium]|nr:WD40 repeat domain-containing serine/threonine-protein kinase [Burkholderiaceae bacterium]